MAVILQQASSWQCSRYFPILKKARHGSRVRYFRQKTQVQNSFHPRLFACIRSAFSYRSTTLFYTINLRFHEEWQVPDLRLQERSGNNSRAHGGSTYKGVDCWQACVEVFVHQAERNLCSLILDNAF